ncbi:MAG: RsmE family RNA methyltransferase [bacterium]|nr:RsmE family RNA methyltransferase [bacterium]
MRLHRFYLQANQIDKGKINSSTDLSLAHQLRSVFRLHEGSRVIFFDGSGHEYVSDIVSLNKSEVMFRVAEERAVKRCTELRLTLAFSLIKKDNAEWVIEKGTELGVSEFVPLVSERSEKKGFNIERATKKTIEAAEQSGRADIADVREPVDLNNFLALETRPIVVFHTDGMTLAETNLPTSGELVACIGPEGGWSDREIEAFKAKGAIIVRLQSPVLRAETAAVAITTLLLVK